MEIPEFVTQDPTAMLVILLWIATCFLESLSLVLRFALKHKRAAQVTSIIFKVVGIITIIATCFWVSINHGFLILQLGQVLGG